MDLPSKSMREVFLSGNFFSLWLGQVVAQFGERLSQMALIGLLYEQKNVDTQSMSLLLVFMVLPVFIFNPIAGLCVDLWDRKKILIWSDCLRGLLLCLLPVVLIIWPSTGSLGLAPVYVMVFLIFSVARFFIPAKTAIIPEIMDSQDLRAANAISATTKMIATVFGVLGGGVIVTYMGASACFYLNGACFFVSAASIAFVKRKHPIQKKDSEDSVFVGGRVKQIYVNLKAGMSELRHNPEMSYLVKVLSIFMFAGGVIFVVFPVFVHRHYDVLTNGLGIFISFLGVGLFVGAMSMGKSMLVQSHKRLLSISLIMVALLFLIFVNIHSFFIACVLMFLIGVSGVPVIICTETMIQDLVDDDKIGRVYTSVEIVIHAAFLLAMAAAGFLGERCDAGVLLMVSVALSVLIFIGVIARHVTKGRKFV